MRDAICIENGNMGRIAYVRIAPNEDLARSAEKLCFREGFRNAFVRGALGSLLMRAWPGKTTPANRSKDLRLKL